MFASCFLCAGLCVALVLFVCWFVFLAVCTVGMLFLVGSQFVYEIIINPYRIFVKHIFIVFEIFY